jgi:hypothetical protein
MTNLMVWAEVLTEMGYPGAAKGIKKLVDENRHLRSKLSEAERELAEARKFPVSTKRLYSDGRDES